MKTICKSCKNVRSLFKRSVNWRCSAPWTHRWQNAVTGKFPKLPRCVDCDSGVCTYYRPKEESVFSVMARFAIDTWKMILHYTWIK